MLGRNVVKDLTREQIKNPKSVEFVTFLEQARHELALMKRVPEMGDQRDQLESQIGVAEACIKATEAGFDRVYPSSSWYWGFLGKPSRHVWPAERGFSVYARALPSRAIEELDRARKLGVFMSFTVHAPDGALFNRVAPVIKVVDPILVGWIYQYRFPYDGPQGNAFLISAWDIARDLAFNQRQLPEGK